MGLNAWRLEVALWKYVTVETRFESPISSYSQCDRKSLLMSSIKKYSPQFIQSHVYLLPAMFPTMVIIH